MKSVVMLKRLVIAVLVMGLAACASQTAPLWIEHAEQEFSAQQYLSAVAEADSREAADGRARANLSRIFEVSINDSSQDFSQVIVSASQGEKQFDNQQRAARTVNSYAKQVLEGSQIVRNWRSPEGRVYSLAVLEKAPANARFLTAIVEADRNVASLIEFAEQQADYPIVALRALDSARKAQLNREELNRNLSVTRGNGLSAAHSLSAIETRIRDLLAQFSIDVAVSEPALQAELQNAAIRLGMKVASPSRYQLLAAWDTEPLQQKQGWWWLRGSVELTLSDRQQLIAKQRWSVKQSSVDAGMVAQRLRDDLNGQLTEYLYQLLTTSELQP